MKVLSIKTNKTGDTIVEVLIALTILSLAMSISYSVTNSSITALSAARSGARATALLQKQIELLRISSINDPSTWVVANTYCIDESKTPPTPPRTIKTTDNCTFDGYEIGITKTGDNYTATAKWNIGNKEYKATMVYGF